MAKSFAVFFSPFDHGRYGELVRTKIRSTCYNSKGFNSYGGFRCIWCYLYKSWQSAVTKESFDASSPQVPLLMLSADKDDDYENFTLFPRRKLQAVFLPEAKGRVSFNTGMGDPVTALNSKLVSASLAASLFSFALFKYSKSEPSNEISALKNEASEKLGFSVKGWLPVSALPVIFPLITTKINSPF
uniref:Uncharacterized protein n=1 Tax=Solanum tuberosum TaxID=4113 RepID=M0ZUB5_SOLTU